MLEVCAVNKCYRGAGASREVLREVSLTLAPACLATLCGPSGSGKTTLLNIIATFDKPDAGQVWLAGKLLHGLAPREAEAVRQREIGFVFQDFGLLPSLTARENVEMALIANRVSRSRRRALAREALVSVGVDELAGRFPHEMSAGQRQRVGIARAIVKRPKIVIADEPTANLDAQSASALVTLIRELAREAQTAFLVATHDSRLVEAALKRFALSNGRLCKVGAV